MSVEITPSSQLGFTRPLTRLITQAIKIHNPHPHPIAFKVKTTAPKQYCVRPNAGRVESGESVEVQVLLQPLSTEPPPHAKCKDKFLVQSAFITPDEEMRSLTEMWSQTEKTNKSAIQEQKIKVAYLAPEDGIAPNGIQEEEEPQESRVLDESYHSPAAHITGAWGGVAVPVGGEGAGYAVWTTKAPKELAEPKFRNGGYSYWETVQLPYIPPGSQAIFTQAQSSPLAQSNGDMRSAPQPATAIPPTSSSPVNVPVTETSHTKQEPKDIPSLSSKDIQAVGVSPTNAALEDGLSKTTSDAEKLKLALAEVDRLRAQLAEAQGPQVTGLRKRGVGATIAADGPVAGAEVAVEKVKEAVHAPSGVPIEVVAGLLVGVFVMTYLFF